MVKRLAIIGAIWSAPLASAGAQLSCLTSPAVAAPWPAPLDRQVVIGDGVLSVKDAIERAGTVARVHFTYQADLLPQDRTVCAGVAKIRLGDALLQWLDGSRLKAVVAGDDRVVLALMRSVSAAPLPTGSSLATAQLAPVVVVEQGQPSPRENETISRTVVSGEQLEATGSPTMAQALSGAVPGLWMWNPSPTSIGGGMASLRGASSFGANYPKVYVDGIEVANPLFLSQLSTDQIAQVEVIRGPQGSALYGAGAIGGVINITTRMAAGMHNGRRVSLRSTAGIAESAYSPLGAFVQDHAFSAQMGDAGRSMGLGLSTSTIGAFIPGAFSQVLHASAGAGFVGTRNRLQLTARFFSQRAGNTTSPLLPNAAPVLTVTSGPPSRGGPSTGTNADPMGLGVASTDSGAAQDVRQYTVGGTWAVASDRWTHTVVAGADGYRLENVALVPGMLRTPGDSALLAASGGADRASVRWSGTTEFGSRAGVSTRLTVGADHSALRDASLGTSVGQPDAGVSPIWRNTSGVSAHGDMTIARSITLNGGLRLERNAGFTILSGLAALPSIGAAYRRRVGPAAVTLRTAYGKAISPARVSMRTTPWGGRAPAILSLEPEEQAGIEFGADVSLGSRFTARLTRYDQRATNLVQPVMAVSGPGGGRGFSYQWQNVGAITNDGWELESNVAMGALSLTGALGLTDSRVERVAYGYSGDLRAGDRVLQVPKRTASLSATWLGRGWSGSGTLARASQWMNYDWITLSGDLSDPQMTPPHGEALRAYWRNYSGVTRLRASFTRDITTALGLVVSGENLLNAQAGEPDNVTIVPGRTLRAGISARF